MSVLSIDSDSIKEELQSIKDNVEYNQSKSYIEYLKEQHKEQHKKYVDLKIICDRLKKKIQYLVEKVNVLEQENAELQLGGDWKHSNNFLEQNFTHNSSPQFSKDDESQNINLRYLEPSQFYNHPKQNHQLSRRINGSQ